MRPIDPAIAFFTTGFVAVLVILSLLIPFYPHNFDLPYIGEVPPWGFFLLWWASGAIITRIIFRLTRDMDGGDKSSQLSKATLSVMIGIIGPFLFAPLGYFSCMCFGHWVGDKLADRKWERKRIRWENERKKMISCSRDRPSFP